MQWKSDNRKRMVDLSRVDAYEYTSAKEFIDKKDPSHPLYNSFKMHGNYIKLYLNGAIIEFHGEEADQIYNLLNPLGINDTID